MQHDFSSRREVSRRMASIIRATTRFALGMIVALLATRMAFPAALPAQDRTPAGSERPTLDKVAKEKKYDKDAGPRPDFEDVPYGSHERLKLDLWKVKSDQPTPILVFFHGGGGDKLMFRGNRLLAFCLRNGISAAAVNYRPNNQVPFPVPMQDAGRAIQFLRSKANDFNIDPKRVAAWGTSLGANVSLWLAYHDDIADPKSGDPVLRESSRLCFVISNAGQTFNDMELFRQRVYPYKLPAMPERGDAEGGSREKAREISAIYHVTKDDPPILMTYGFPLKELPLPKDTPRGELIHNPAFGLLLKEKLDEMEIENHFYHGGNKPPAGAEEAFILKHFFNQRAESPAMDQGRPPGKTPLEIIRDRYGVPHIFSDSLGGACFAQGYCHVEDNPDEMLAFYLEARGAAAKTFGQRQVESDYWSQAFHLQQISRRIYESLPPESRAIVDAYAAGVNQDLTNHPDTKPAWFDAATGLDVVAAAKAYQLRQMLGDARKDLSGVSPAGRQVDEASNMWAVGPKLSRNGEVMLASDPHLPWHGLTRWHEAHLIVGDRWIYGATFFGSPGVGIGFTQDLAWGSTNNGADIADVCRVVLEPGNPDRYRYEDQWRPITTETVHLEVRQPDGTLRPVERTVRRTHHGPILQEDRRRGLAFAVRLAGLEEGCMAVGWLGYFHAERLADLERFFDRNDEFKWHRILADRHGDIGYYFFASTHRRSALSQAAIEIGDRRTEHVDVGAVQHASQRVVAGGGGTVGDRAEFKNVAVEENHQLPARRGAPHGVRHVADAVGHRLLLKLRPIDQRTLGRRIAEHPGRRSAAGGRRRHRGGAARHLRVVPRAPQRRVAAVTLLEPLPPGRQVGRRVPTGRPRPGPACARRSAVPATPCVGPSSLRRKRRRTWPAVHLRSSASRRRPLFQCSGP